MAILNFQASAGYAVGLMMPAAILLAGCGASIGDLSTGSIAGYTEANMFSPQGYKIAALPEGGFRVTATGSAGTPPERLEKIAIARAADYGVEQHLKSFKATTPQRGFNCGKSETISKGEKVKLAVADYRVVQVDVTYSNDANDPSARSSKETAEQLKAQIATESVPPDVQQALIQDTARQCGRVPG